MRSDTTEEKALYVYLGMGVLVAPPGVLDGSLFIKMNLNGVAMHEDVNVGLIHLYNHNSNLLK